jgi:hypothetical protein
MPEAEELSQHLAFVAHELAGGDVVPILGAGANLCDRPANAEWRQGGESLPNAGELAEWLADELKCQVTDPKDLLRVAQYALEMLGGGPLYKQLRSLFAGPGYRLPTLHRLLGGLPSRMEANGLPRKHLLIVTTNYDDLMERALVEAGEPFDVVRYIAKRRARQGGKAGTAEGRFIHEHYPAPVAASEGGGREAGAVPTDRLPAPAWSKIIAVPKRYRELSLEERTVVLKIHGGFDRRDAASDSYVITEDDYIDYLTDTSPNDLIPAHLLAKLLDCHFLFLGYAMRDWNLRVILHRIWEEREQSWESWAIQRDVQRLDKKMWARHGVELYDLALADYTSKLSEALEAQIASDAERGRRELSGAVG